MPEEISSPPVEDLCVIWLQREENPSQQFAVGKNGVTCFLTSASGFPTRCAANGKRAFEASSSARRDLCGLGCLGNTLLGESFVFGERERGERRPRPLLSSSLLSNPKSEDIETLVSPACPHEKPHEQKHSDVLAQGNERAKRKAAET